MRKILKLLAIREGTWEVHLVNDRAMAELHGRTMNDPTTTDVLTFDLRDTPRNQKSRIRNQKSLDLHTAICIDEARRRAAEHGHTVREELLLYCVHSLLHVQGYDDTTAAQAARMHAREDELLEAIGIGRVYDKRNQATANPAAPRKRGPA